MHRFNSACRTLGCFSLGIITVQLLVFAAIARAADKPSLRVDGLGDPLPDGALARLGTVRWRHGSNVSFVAFADGGKELLTSCGDGIVHVWDARTGKELRAFGKQVTLMGDVFWSGPLADSGDANVYCWVCASNDGKIVVTAVAGGRIRTWDAATGKELASFEFTSGRGSASGHSYCPMDLLVMPDGQQLVTRDFDGRIKFWDVASGKLSRVIDREVDSTFIWPAPHLPQHRLSLSPDGKRAVDDWIFPHEGRQKLGLRIWDLKDGKEIRKIEQDQTGWLGPVFSTDGKLIASALPNNNCICAYDATSGKELQRFQLEEKTRKGDPPAPAGALRFSPDGKTLAVLDRDERLFLFEVASGKLTRRLSDEPPCFDGKDLRPNVAGTVEFLAAGATVAWSPDGKSIAQAWGHAVRTWDVETGKGNDLGGGHFGEVSGLLIAPGGKTVQTVSRDNTVRQWNVRTGMQEQSFLLPPKTTAALLPNEKHALVGEDFPWRSLFLRDLTTEKAPLTIEQPGNGANLMCLSANGKICATATPWVRLCVFDLESGKKLRESNDLQPTHGPDAKVDRTADALACSADGSKLLVRCNEYRTPASGKGSTRQMLALYDTTTAKLQWHTDTKLSQCHALAFSFDSRMVALINGAFTGQGSVSDLARSCEVVLLETATGKERARFELPASTLSFSPDGRFLAIGMLDGSLKVLTLDGKEVAGWQGHRGRVRCLAFAADTEILFSGGTEGTVLVWEISEQVRKARLPAEVDADTAKGFWADLASNDAAKAYRAVTALAVAPKQAIALLSVVMKPVISPGAGELDKLIAALDSDDFDKREAAFKELANLRELAKPALQRALDGKPSQEQRKRIGDLLQKLPADGSLPTSEMLRQLRALEVLEAIATPEARALLETLAKGAEGARLTQEADAALKRLESRK